MADCIIGPGEYASCQSRNLIRIGQVGGAFMPGQIMQGVAEDAPETIGAPSGKLDIRFDQGLPYLLVTLRSDCQSTRSRRLAQESEPLRPDFLGQRAHPGSAASGLIQAGDQSGPHRVAGEDDRDRRARAPQIDIPTRAGQDGALLGKRTVNTEPLPSSLATVTSPPIMRASLRVMARPSPVPPTAFLSLGRAGESLRDPCLCPLNAVPVMGVASRPRPFISRLRSAPSAPR